MWRTMKNNRIAHMTALLLTSALFHAGDAHAQTVDYGSFQSLFGEPVTTSATGNPQRVSEVPANMTIITADEIRQSGSRSIPEILSRVPGLDILQDSISSFFCRRARLSAAFPAETLGTGGWQASLHR